MTKTKLARIAFLLGSGISCPAGLPSIGEITDCVLSGKRFRKHSSNVWEMTKQVNGKQTDISKDVWRVTTFLKRLKAEADLYYLYDKDRTTNYEDLYHLAAQVNDSVMGKYHNPALKPFLDSILPDVRVLFAEDEEDNRSEIVRDHQGLAYLSDDTTNYITDVVWRVIQNKQLSPAPLTHLNCITCACQEVERVDLFTVNHDTLLEDCLRQSSIEITDGFGAEDEFHIRHWNPQVFESVATKVCLIKPHGSLDWFYFRGINEDRTNHFLGLHPNPGQEFLENNGRLVMELDGRPVLLIGTVNKMLEYLRGIFLQLHLQFYHRLAQTNRLVVSGYGFGDDGINMRIHEWMQSSDDRKLVVIDPNPESVRKKFGGHVRDERKEQSKLLIEECGIEQISWERIKELLLQ